MTKTTITHYCDRCGKQIERQNTFIETPLKMQIMQLRKEWEYVELCDTCVDSFVSWWNKCKHCHKDDTGLKIDFCKGCK